MKKLHERRADALLDYLSALPDDHWASEEEIIAALPEYFISKPRPNATSLDGNIYAAMNLINKRGGVIVVNNNRRAYKLATKEDAEAFKKNTSIKELGPLYERQTSVTSQRNITLLT